MRRRCDDFTEDETVPDDDADETCRSVMEPGVESGDTIRYDTIEEINVDSKAEYTA